MTKIELKPVGHNGFFDLRNQIDKFVKQNFNMLYEGAVRLGMEIPADYYAPQRIQINNTRLHNNCGLKYADGHKYDDQYAPSETQLKNTIVDIQELINAAAVEIPAPFTLTISYNK